MFLNVLLLATTVASDEGFNLSDEGLSLLQLRSTNEGVNHRTAMMTNISRSRQLPGERERQLCPHEIEEIHKDEVSFGCRGLLKAPATRSCSIWGDPHVSRTFPLENDIHKIPGTKITNWDVLTKPGLFRLAAAADGSWEVQMMSCGTWAAAAAARFGNHVVEFVSTANNQVAVFLNGKELGDKVEWPVQVGNMFIDNSHLKANTHWAGGDLRTSAKQAKRGGCVDDPGGQLYVDVSKVGSYWQTFSVLIEAAEGSFTTNETDSLSVCNVDIREGRQRYQDWVDNVAAEDSLFVGSGIRACDHCKRLGWEGSFWHYTVEGRNAGHKSTAAAKKACEQAVPKTWDNFDVSGMCQKHNISVESAQKACVHLKDDDHFYEDCQLDFCSTDGNQEAADEAENEEHAENPQPVCAVPDNSCDPASLCCDALKDKALLNFENVVQNNLCGDGDGARELRYGSVLSQDGKAWDLVVKAIDHNCGKVTNDKNGIETEKIGKLAIEAGSEGTFEFQFVLSGTNTLAPPKSMIVSFLDLDEGKRGKQRESVEVCGAVNAVVDDTTELKQSKNGNCLKFQSSTWGNGKDNPKDPETMSVVQRSRAVAYEITGSSFTATLKVTKGNNKGNNNNRKFLFAGHPSLTCAMA